jgi:hypothetical protein
MPAQRSRARVPSAAQTAARLLSALGELTAQQSIWLRVGNCTRALAAQRRAAPLVAGLSALEGDPALDAIRPRLGELLARRRENQALLAERRKGFEEERRRLTAARERLRQLRFYAGQTAPAPFKRLNAAV